MEQGVQATFAPFGTAFASQMPVAYAHDGVFTGEFEVEPVAPFQLHPSTHVLHYGSACFEGLKAHRGSDGVVRLFRARDHARRFADSAAALCLPIPEPDFGLALMHAAVSANRDEVPAPPGALYLRPTLIGLDPNIGAAGTPSMSALLYVLCSPVGDYFTGGHALTLAVETQLPRSTPQFGRVKTGANYAMALGITMRAREQGADQVLFAPGGDVQETGASNFLLVDEDRIVTKALDNSFLHGVTRDSVLTLARSLGFTVEERDIDVAELPTWTGEMALVGTAAVLSGVGALLLDGQRHEVGGGVAGPVTQRLRDALVAIQRAEAPDEWGWTEPVA